LRQKFKADAVKENSSFLELPFAVTDERLLSLILSLEKEWQALLEGHLEGI